MQQLEENRINQLLSIVNLYPSTRIMHFSQGHPLLNQKIAQLCQEHGYEFQINSTDDADYEYSIQEFETSEYVSLKKFNLRQPRYNIQAKLYDYLFVTSTIEEADRASFLKKSHGVIKNAGLILIFVPKQKDKKEVYNWMQELEENYFVASNNLDTFEYYDVIISKKMHGWGG